MNPDLIHFEFGTIAAGKMHLKECLNCQTVVSFRGYDLNYIGLDEPGYYQDIWDKADGIHLLGKDLWQRAQSRGCPPTKFHFLIPPGIELGKFDRQEKDYTDGTAKRVRSFRLVSVGRLEWKKGYEYALQAVKFLVDQGIPCEYRIVGDGNYLGALAFARHQLGLNGIVHFLGALPYEGVKEQLLWSDAFLHSAVSEGFSNAVLEAQAMGLPVVCSDADGLPENVSDGETGFVVPRRNPEEMARKLAMLAKDSKLRERLGLAGIERVSSIFNINDQITLFKDFYNQIIFHKK